MRDCAGPIPKRNHHANGKCNLLCTIAEMPNKNLWVETLQKSQADCCFSYLILCCKLLFVVSIYHYCTHTENQLIVVVVTKFFPVSLITISLFHMANASTAQVPVDCCFFPIPQLPVVITYIAMLPALLHPYKKWVIAMSFWIFLSLFCCHLNAIALQWLVWLLSSFFQTAIAPTFAVFSWLLLSLELPSLLFFIFALLVIAIVVVIAPPT